MPTTTAQVQQIANIVVPVADVDAAIDFYTASVSNSISREVATERSAASQRRAPGPRAATTTSPCQRRLNLDQVSTSSTLLESTTSPPSIRPGDNPLYRQVVGAPRYRPGS
jgi:hypothetical protein